MHAYHALQLIKNSISPKDVDSIEIVTNEDMEIIIDDHIFRIHVEADIL